MDIAEVTENDVGNTIYVYSILIDVVFYSLICIA